MDSAGAAVDGGGGGRSSKAMPGPEGTSGVPIRCTSLATWSGPRRFAASPLRALGSSFWLKLRARCLAFEEDELLLHGLCLFLFRGERLAIRSLFGESELADLARFGCFFGESLGLRWLLLLEGTLRGALLP